MAAAVECRHPIKQWHRNCFVILAAHGRCCFAQHCGIGPRGACGFGSSGSSTGLGPSRRTPPLRDSAGFAPDFVCTTSASVAPRRIRAARPRGAARRRGRHRHRAVRALRHQPAGGVQAPQGARGLRPGEPDQAPPRSAPTSTCPASGSSGSSTPRPSSWCGRIPTPTSSSAGLARAT